jgi:hypothetical protein
MIRYIMLTAILMATTSTFSQTNVSSEKITAAPSATVGGFINGDYVARNSFTSQIGIGVYGKFKHSSAAVMDDNSPVKTTTVTSFLATVIRNGVSVFNSDNTGNVFNEKTRSFFNSLEPGDIVLFSGISALQQYDNNKTNIQEMTLKPLLYIIK